MADEKHQRGITSEFKEQRKSGILFPILQRVQHDDTLSLEIRNGYIDIYYRGGRLLGIHAQAKAAKFSVRLDDGYLHGAKGYCPEWPELPGSTIECDSDAQAWVDAFATCKQVMDIWFFEHPKIEREYQQAVVRENNRHKTGDLSDYVVVDVEYSQSAYAVPGQKTGYRFDMVGLRWPAKGKTRRSRLVTPVIMEMKVGDGALATRPDKKDPAKLSPGLAKHVKDIERFLAPQPGKKRSEPYDLLCEELVEMFETKKRLDLPCLPKRMKGLTISDEDVSDRPEVLFILAGHQPASKALEQELERLPLRVFADYGVAIASYAGYALFADNVIPLDDFVKRGLANPQGKALWHPASG